MIPKIKIVNAETNDVIEREMTEDEYKSFLENEEKSKNFLKEINANISKKKDILNKLGITEEEAKLLLS